MQKKRSSNSSSSSKNKRFRKTRLQSTLTYLNSSNAKVLFFGIYFIITMFMFREFLFSDNMLFGGDTIPDGVYTRKLYKEFHNEYGGVPRWNPYVLGGLPFVDAMHGDTFYPGAWLKFFIPLERALGHKLVWHVFLAGIAMFVFLRSMGNRRDASFLGGLMYMLAPSFVSQVYPGHDAKMYIIAWLPLAFAALEFGMQKATMARFALLGGLMGLLILTSHVQMAYYAYWALGLYFLYRLYDSEDHSFKAIALRSSLFVMAVVFALMLGAVQLFPAYKFSTSQSVRTGGERSTYEYATSWSMHPEEVAGMLVPSFQGNTYIDTRGGSYYGVDHYWGKNVFKLNSEYHGLLPMLLALFAMICTQKKRRWFFLGIAFLSLIYALGADTPFYRLFYALVPGVKVFRAPSMIIFLFAFSIVAMATDFISDLFEGESSLELCDRRILVFGGFLFAAAVVITLGGESFFRTWAGIFFHKMPDFRVQTMLANIPFVISDLWRILILSLAALGGLWMFSTKKIGNVGLIALFALVTFIDQSVVCSRFITTVDPNTYPLRAPVPAIKKIQEKMREEGPFRVFDPSRPNNYYAMFGISTVSGSHNNELQSYELFRGPANSHLTKFWVIDRSLYIEGLALNNFLKVAGVKYLLLQNQPGSIGLVKNEYALPRAFVVHGFVAVPSDTAAVKLLGDASFDPSTTATLEADESDLPFKAATGVSGSVVSDIEYTEWGAEIHCSCTAPGYLVLSDNYVPYWRAEVDGVDTEIIRANVTFMAVPCDAGDHVVRFIFHSVPYEAGGRLTLFAIALIILILIASEIFLYLRVKKAKEQ